MLLKSCRLTGPRLYCATGGVGGAVGQKTHAAAEESSWLTNLSAPIWRSLADFSAKSAKSAHAEATAGPARLHRIAETDNQHAWRGNEMERFP
jgi:hypothetical protein